MADQINVEVAYALPSEQVVIPVTLAKGATLYDAVVASGIASQFEEINPDTIPMGVFGKAVRKPKEQALEDGERVELYRPLLIDPKTARANRAAKAKAKKALEDN